MDNAIRLKNPDLNNSVTIKEIWVTQEDVDGIHDLITWIDGFVRGNPGTIPGHFNTVMFYRKLGTYINEAQRAQKNDTEKELSR